MVPMHHQLSHKIEAIVRTFTPQMDHETAKTLLRRSMTQDRAGAAPLCHPTQPWGHTDAAHASPGERQN